MATSSKQRFIFALKEESELGFVLLISSGSNFKDDIISGTIIDQKGRKDHHVIFQGSQNVKVSKEKVIERIQVKCQQEGNRYLINLQDYNTMIYDLTRDESKKKERSSYNYNREDSSNSDSSSSENEHSQSHSNHKKSFRQNRSDFSNHYPIESYGNDDDSDDNEKERGRGRPKGSKNKKTLMKEIIQNNQIMMELKMAITGKIKRGKGRPKGSKNKPKEAKFQYGQVKLQQNESAPFGKRGKGRPKGSKNKVKTFTSNQLHQLDQHNPVVVEKRGRGRPKGAKNKANSVVSGTLEQEMEEEFVKIEYVPINAESYQNISCCSRCAQQSLKKKVFYGDIEIEESLESLKNVTEDYGVENKTNLIVLAIKLGDWQTLDHLLGIVDQTEIYLQPPFNLGKITEKTKFGARTKKQVLSKTGKEGIYVLLHDHYQRKQHWWDDIGIDRIIDNLPKQSHSAIEIFSRLINFSPILKKELYQNVVSIIRKGNQIVGEFVLADLLENPQLNDLNFSQEHFCLLAGDYPVLNQLKKYYIIWHNSGNNFCSPVHCAAMSANVDFLRKLLNIFTDIINVEDSQHRKLIHYASVAPTYLNLELLMVNGADLKETDRKKMTPLMLACEQGLRGNVEFILQKVRDPYYINFLSDEGYTALQYAILNSHEECAALLINDPLTQPLKQTRNKEDIFHLLAGTGNIDILELFIKKQVRPIHSLDRFKRTPSMIAVRNHNNEFFYRIIEEGCRIDKVDSSHNSLLHYAAAYGNLEVIAFLKAQIEDSGLNQDQREQHSNLCHQEKNKKGLYPWQIAVLKGHMQCAKILEDFFEEDEEIELEEDIVSQLLTNIQGTKEYYENLVYAFEKFGNIEYEGSVTGNSYLHLVCMLGEDEYRRRRKSATNQSVEEIDREFRFINEKLIDFFLKKGLDGQRQNRKKQTPLKMCLENYNLTGFKKLLVDKIDFELESSNGYGVMHCISNLACRGLEEMVFVEKKLKSSNITELRVALKKVDHNGFDFLQYFVKNFVTGAKKHFLRIIAGKKSSGVKKDLKTLEKESVDEYLKFEDKFIKLMTFFIDLGCDPNGQVISNKNNSNQKYKKWSIQHFLMEFPSIRLLKYFKNKIRDFNAVDNNNQTCLHEFCLRNVKGSLLPTESYVHEDLLAENSLKFLMTLNIDPNIRNHRQSLAILFAAQKMQYEFMLELIKHESLVNFCSSENKVPFIEIIKHSRNFSLSQIKTLLKLGCAPNFTDKNKRNALHHLVYCSQSFDSSPEICKLLLEYNGQVNSLDVFERSPIFYCFVDIEHEPIMDALNSHTRVHSIPNSKFPKNLRSTTKNESIQAIEQSAENLEATEPQYSLSCLDPQEQSEDSFVLDKVEILQVLMNLKETNLNILDINHRTLVHYACEKNYFYSILYLLDKNINIEVKDREQNTPLAVCLKSKNLDQAALIIKKGIKYGYVNDKQSGTKMSYFSYAIKHLSVGICFMLLDHGYPIQKALEEVSSQVFKKVLIQKYIK